MGGRAGARGALQKDTFEKAFGQSDLMQQPSGTGNDAGPASEPHALWRPERDRPAPGGPVSCSLAAYSDFSKEPESKKLNGPGSSTGYRRGRGRGRQKGKGERAWSRLRSV